MFKRHLHSLLSEELRLSPAVALLGPRQVGKTTLALEVARAIPHVYLDLESERDRGKLAGAEMYLESHLDKLVILDEVHRAPGLFPVLRGLIDQARRLGHSSGQYLLLGSASLDVLQQSGETLAGRIAYLERDIPQFGPRIAAETLRRFWTMLAHHQGGMLNVAQLARNLGVDAKTAQSYIDLMCDLLLVRRLAPWHTNTGKRLVKAPKVYVRDSGLVHALLNIETKDNLLSHMVVGASWEGFCIETILACAPAGVTGYFYRTSGGAEIDLLLAWPGGDLWAIEVKRSSAPKVERGFYSACDDLNPSQKWVVYPGQEAYPISADIQAISLHGLCEKLTSLNRQ